VPWLKCEIFLAFYKAGKTSSFATLLSVRNCPHSSTQW